MLTFGKDRQTGVGHVDVPRSVASVGVADNLKNPLDARQLTSLHVPFLRWLVARAATENTWREIWLSPEVRHKESSNWFQTSTRVFGMS